jgi:hypothetical protein
MLIIQTIAVSISEINLSENYIYQSRICNFQLMFGKNAV